MKLAHQINLHSKINMRKLRKTSTIAPALRDMDQMTKQVCPNPRCLEGSSYAKQHKEFTFDWKIPHNGQQEREFYTTTFIVKSSPLERGLEVPASLWFDVPGSFQTLVAEIESSVDLIVGLGIRFFLLS